MVKKQTRMHTLLKTGTGTAGTDYKENIGNPAADRSKPDHSPKTAGKKRILILSYYYSPDLCAGSFRCTSFVKQLQACDIADYQIDLITTKPNRYASYTMDAPEKETHGNVTIQRISLPPHKSAPMDQSRGFLHYAKEVIKMTKKQEYCLVFATSSRLMTAVLGAYIAKKKKARLYLDIRDLFLDTFNDAFPKLLKMAGTPVFSFLERWAFNKADRINMVSRGFLGYFKARYPADKSYRFYTNGIDEEFISLDSPHHSKESAKPYTVLYAGNIGEGQGLHLIIPALADKLSGVARFIIIGDGGRKEHLQAAIEGKGNVKLLPPVSRKELLAEYQSADVLFLHLNDYPAFRKVLPSKIFEYAATGKPIIAGVEGYCAEFIQQEIANAKIFSPCDTEAAYKAFLQVDLNPSDRSEFIHRYAREKIMQTMAEDVLKCVAPGSGE